MRSRSNRLTITACCFLALVAGCFQSQKPWRTSQARNRSTADRLGTRFISDGLDVHRAPALTEIPIPEFPGAHAIWGGTGRDDAGNIWFGVCAKGPEIPSAHLFSYDPSTDVITPRGDVVTWLKMLGIWRVGEGQMKIHSKIVEADDGLIYFASMDERGESASRMEYPTWGGHLWRIDPHTNQWEHLLSTKEALIAVSSTGRYVYALGYFHHMLYQYDTKTAEVQSVEVGSFRAHITRNFLTDLNHHVYVPRVRADEIGENLTTELVEFDENLHEIGASKLQEYQADGFFGSHGLVGYVCLADGSILFTSSTGFLWHLQPRESGPAVLREIGWFHPDGKSYPPSLVTFDGKSWIAGLTRSYSRGIQWVVRNLDQDEVTVLELDEADQDLIGQGQRLLYGTNTRDNDGNIYFVGRQRKDDRYGPVLLRGTFAKLNDQSKFP